MTNCAVVCAKLFYTSRCENQFRSELWFASGAAGVPVAR